MADLSTERLREMRDALDGTGPFVSPMLPAIDEMLRYRKAEAAGLEPVEAVAIAIEADYRDSTNLEFAIRAALQRERDAATVRVAEAGKWREALIDVLGLAHVAGDLADIEIGRAPAGAEHAGEWVAWDRKHADEGTLELKAIACDLHADAAEKRTEPVLAAARRYVEAIDRMDGSGANDAILSIGMASRILFEKAAHQKPNTTAAIIGAMPEVQELIEEAGTGPAAATEKPAPVAEPAPAEVLGVCDNIRWVGDHPHIRSGLCRNWRPSPADGSGK